MISHEHPRFWDPDYHPFPFDVTPDYWTGCAGCGTETHFADRAPNGVDTGLCDDCRVLCALCGDWMAGQREMLNAEGKRIHVACEVTAIIDAYIDAFGVPAEEVQHAC